MTALPPSGLYALTPERSRGVPHLVRTVTMAIDAGARLIQYRDKGSDAAGRRAEVDALAALTRARDIVLLVNDDVALARASRADGVHLGRDDGTIEDARAALGPNRIIGASCYDSLELALDAERRGADYVAFGAFYPSPTKPHAVRAPVELLRRAHARLAVPIAAIGGILPDNGATLLEAGASYLAASSGVFDQPDIRAATDAYARLFD